MNKLLFNICKYSLWLLMLSTIVLPTYLNSYWLGSFLTFLFSSLSLQNLYIFNEVQKNKAATGAVLQIILKQMNLSDAHREAKLLRRKTKNDTGRVPTKDKKPN